MHKSNRGRSLAFACVSNNDSVLDNNLRRSPVISEGRTRLHIERGAPSASAAYNHALEHLDEDIVVFLHQDVYLPKGWDELLWQRISQVEAVDQDWGLLGSFGIATDDGRGYGPVWSTSLGQIVGRVPEQPMKVQSFDEMLMVMRSSSRLRFDENLNGFHFYGTDIVQIAASKGLASYAVPLPCIHNDKFKGRLDEDYNRSYQFMRRKWKSRLPIQTPTIKVTWHGLNLGRATRHHARDIAVRRSMSQPMEIDPRIYAARCSWSDISPL